MQPDAAAPYCGNGPTPAEVLLRWNLDPWLLAVFAVAFAVCAGRRRPGGGTALLAPLGLAVLAFAFISPLCALSSALFAARTVHHGLLIAVAAPLLAFGLPQRPSSTPLAAATIAQAIVLWGWHAPAAYAWALSDTAAYWLMQLSLLAAALVFWRAVRAASALAAAGALLATMMQMGLLGALLAFAGQPLYAPHFATTWPWGLSPLADQQLAGLIMWAPLSAAYLLAALGLVARSLGREEARAHA